MSYAIIGFGKIGHALAKAFARNGIEVSVATTRDPASFAPMLPQSDPRSFPKHWRKPLVSRRGNREAQPPGGPLKRQVRGMATYHCCSLRDGEIS